MVHKGGKQGKEADYHFGDKLIERQTGMKHPRNKKC